MANHGQFIGEMAYSGSMILYLYSVALKALLMVQYTAEQIVICKLTVVPLLNGVIESHILKS